MILPIAIILVKYCINGGNIKAMARIAKPLRLVAKNELLQNHGKDTPFLFCSTIDDIIVRYLRNDGIAEKNGGNTLTCVKLELPAMIFP